MLDAIRKRSGSIVVKVLLLLLVLSFGAWGIGDYIQGGVSGQAVASVGDHEISPQAFSNEYQREMNRMRRVFGDNLDTDMARTLGIQQTVLDRMIRSQMFAAAAEDQGLLVTNAMVLREIQSMDAFRGLTGNFDKDIFRQVVNNAGYTEDMFLALIRDDLNRGYLLETFENGAVVPDALLKNIYGHREERRSAEIVHIPDAAFPDVAQPENSEIETYHQENAQQFTAPAYRSISYLHLSASDLVSEIAVSDDEVVEAYEANEGEFVTSARRNLEQVIFASEAEANQAIDMMNSGRDFADVAMELAGESADSLGLGWVGRNDLINTALGDAAFSLFAGEISGAIESPLGWHVLRILEAEEETRQSLEDVREKLRSDVALEKAVDSLFSLANALEDQMGGGATLEEAAQALHLNIARLDGVDAQGSDRFGRPVSDLPVGDFLRTIFSTEEGTESPLIESDDDSYFMVRVDSVIDPALRPLDVVRDDVVAAIVADRRRDNAERTAVAVVDAANTGVPLINALAEAKFGGDVVVETVDMFKRNGDGAPQSMPPELSAILFDRALGQGGYARGEGGFVVGQLSGVTPADPVADPDGADTLNDSIIGAIRNDLMDQLAVALQDTYPVSINQNVLDQIVNY